ncbi:hypothetical protein MLD38_012032 [Melastoma candidum]|uniref:Uncharacterized protein n=1 Tax=Melastoma candidum TaxID=119954 RepID=A0ACB9R4Z9_9MYRT|nr:hypothetical protein MLD38_012032 [Melastoma candidum]
MAATGLLKGSSSSQKTKTVKDKTLSGLANLIRLLPTGTVFLFQFLNPVLTNNGQCSSINKYLSATLVGFCGLSCFVSTFTDSFKGSDGVTHYGIATTTGLWPVPSSSSSVNLSSYKIRAGDFVHAFLSLIVFATVSLLDPNTVDCFYPSFMLAQKVLLMVLPPVIGTISGTIFAVFPITRHGIGYPASSSADSQDESP